MYALKYTHLIKEKVGHDTRVYDFYIDMRCFGKGYEEFYRSCQEEGTMFIRGKVAEITDQAASTDEQGKLIVLAEDTLSRHALRVPVDMVVLCAAMEAREDASDVGRVFGVNQGADGFFLEEHPKLGPLNTATDGVFLAGRLPGSQGYSRRGGPGLRRGGQGAVPGQPRQGRDPVGHFLDRSRHLRRVPDLHQALPLCGHRV